MPRAKVNFSKKSSGSNSGFKLFIIICILLFAQNAFLLYRNYDKVTTYLDGFFAASDSTGIEAAEDSLFYEDTNPADLTDNKDSKSEKQDNAQIVKNAQPNADIASQSLPGKIIKVSILNGCGVSGLAGKWKTTLRSMNYDVRETDNSRESYQNSIIICRIDDKTSAYELAKKLGISKKNVMSQKNKNIVDIDITLVLGKDYQNIKSN